MTAKPSRSEVWTVNLDPAQGHEQAGRRPALVISVDEFNHGPSGLVTVVPITGRDRGIPCHIRVEPREGGLSETSYILSDQTRTISRERLHSWLGVVKPETMARIEDNVRILLGL